MMHAPRTPPWNLQSGGLVRARPPALPEAGSLGSATRDFKVTLPSPRSAPARTFAAHAGSTFSPDLRSLHAFSAFPAHFPKHSQNACILAAGVAMSGQPPKAKPGAATNVARLVPGRLFYSDAWDVPSTPRCTRSARAKTSPRAFLRAPPTCPKHVPNVQGRAGDQFGLLARRRGMLKFRHRDSNPGRSGESRVS